MLALSVFAVIGFTSCGSDDDGDDGVSNCVTCDAYELIGQSVPEFEVCEGSDGNAYVDGVDSGTEYSIYITAQEALTDCN